MKAGQLALGALAGVVLFVVGMGVGLMVAEMPAPAPPSSSGLEPGSDPSRSSPDRDAPERRTADPADGSDAGGPRRRRDDSGAGGLAAALERFDPPLVAPGSGTIRGTVRTAAGLPLEGVRVVAAPRRPEDGLAPRAPAVDQSLESAVRDQVERHLFQLATKVEARTDGEGAFLLEGITTAEYGVSAWQDGYSIRPPKSRATEVSAHAGASIEFVAGVVVDVPVRVVLPDGGTPDSAEVRVSTAGSRSSAKHVWVAARPTLQVPPGSYSVLAVAGNDLEYQSEPVALEVAEGDSPGELVLNLGERPGIRGRLLYPPGQEFPRSYVYLLRDEPGVTAGSDDLKARGKRSRVNGAAPFRYLDLEPGTYHLGAVLASGEITVTQTVEVGSALVDVELTLPPLARSDYVLVTAEGPGASPVENVRVSVGYRVQGRVSSRSATSVRQPDGTVLALHRDAGKYASRPGIQYFVLVISPVYGTTMADYTLGAEPAAHATFSEPATLVVDVTGSEERDPTKVVSVRIERRVDGRTVYSHRGVHRAGVDPDGRMTLGPAVPGVYDITVQIQGSSFGRGVGAERTPIELAGGVNEHTITAPPTYSLKVYAPASAPTTRVTLRIGSSSRGVTRTPGSDGAAHFDRLPPGTYTVSLSNSAGVPPRTITIPGRSEVRF